MSRMEVHRSVPRRPTEPAEHPRRTNFAQEYRHGDYSTLLATVSKAYSVTTLACNMISSPSATCAARRLFHPTFLFR